MKKSGRIIWMLSLFSCIFFLSACGKEATLSFEEAKELANKDATLITDMFLNAQTLTQQDLSLTTAIDDGSGTTIDLSLTTQSQQDKPAKKSTSSIAFDADIASEGTELSTSGNLNVLLTADTMFLKIEKFGIQSPDPNIGMMTALLGGLQEQWFKLPLSGSEAMLDGFNNYLSSIAEISKQNTDVLLLKGNEPYQGTFSQFADKPAYQFTLDETKLQTVLQDVVKALNQFNQQTRDTLALPENTEVGDLTSIDVQFPLFDGNLVLLGNDKVATVVDQFEMVTSGVNFEGEYRYSPDGMVFHLREKDSGDEYISINILATKKGTYSVDMQIGTIIDLQGTVTTSLKKTDLSLGFDLTMQLNLSNSLLAENEDLVEEVPVTMTIPLKGQRTYTTLKSINFIEPTDAIDLIEMLGSFMGAGLNEDMYEEDMYGLAPIPEEGPMPTEVE